MYRVSKRLFDLTVAICVGIVALPVVALAAILLRCTQKNVLFRQIRPGLHGKPFALYKFCSMNDARDWNGHLLPDEQRLTRIGSVFRSLSLDELPQLWNVIRGDMSLVGPRPLLMDYLSRYTPEQAGRHNVPPGITGWAQVNGRNELSWEDKFALDLWYVEHRSFSLDMAILGKTFLRVLRRDGISNRKHATMPEFTGNATDLPPLKSAQRPALIGANAVDSKADDSRQ